MLLGLVCVGLAEYLVLFYCTRLPTMEAFRGHSFRRFAYFVYLLFPERLLEGWFGKPAEFALADRLPVLAVAAVVLAVGLSAGWLLLRAVGADRGLTRLETFVFSLAVGLNLLATYVLLAGLAGLLRAAVMAVPGLLIVAAALGLSGPRLTSAFRAFWGLDKQSRSAQGTPARSASEGSTPTNPCLRFGLVCRDEQRGTAPTREQSAAAGLPWLWLAAPFLALIVLGAMLPPVDFDVREYHLQVPKEFYQQGRITHLPHNVYGNMPMGTEMLSLLAMVLCGDWWLGALAGKTVTALFAPLTALGLLAAGRRFFSAPAGAAAAVLYISTPWIVRISTAGLVDMATGCYLLLAVYAMLLWRQGAEQEASGVGQASRMGILARRCLFSPFSRARVGVGQECPTYGGQRDAWLSSGGPPRCRPAASRLLLAGFLAGCAAATKYPGLLFAVVPLAAWSGLAGPRRTAAKRLAIFLAAAALACGPWLAKNAVLTGNPTYPLFYEVFGGRSWTAEKDARWNRVHRPHDFSPSALATGLVQVGLTSQWLSPMVVPLAALALAVRRHRAMVVRLLALFGYVIAAWWLLTHRIDRFWLPALPLLCLAAGVGLGWSGRKSWRWGMAGLLTVVLLANFLVASSICPGCDNRYFVSLRRLSDDPATLTPWHRYFNREAAQGRVLLVGDAEPFDLRMPVLYSTCFDDSPLELLSRGHTAEEVRLGLRARGITHVFVDWDEIARYRQSGYGFSAYFRPEVFGRLVNEGVLRLLPEIEGEAGQGYEVIH